MFATLALALALAFTPAPAHSLEPCQFEDSANCFWDSSERGNGQGVDFHDVDGTAYYACEAEDTANCFWDASQQGNGQGRSFTDVEGVAIFWDTL